MLRWGLVGAGRAGQARARAIAADPASRLVGWHRGTLEDPDLQVFSSLPALLEAVDAVAICSPNGHHAAAVEAALAADKHVVCEFPLALSAARAGGLIALARARGRHLHVGHIALLTARHAWLRARTAGRVLRQGHLAFQSPGGGWLDDPLSAGSLAHRNVARLHVLVDLFGPPTAVRVRHRSGAELRCELTFLRGSIALDLRQGRGLDRQTSLRLALGDGVITVTGHTVRDDGRPVSIPPSPGLFLADQRLACDGLRRAAPPAAPMSRIMGVLSLADQLSLQPVDP